MVFMVYVIMLLDVRDPSFTRRFSHLVIPGAVAGVLLFLALERALGPAGTATMPATVSMTTSDAFSMKAFSVAFLDEYWLYFELTSVLLVAAVVAAVAVIRADGSKRG
jgi:NADH-quinone oxidoreductase subunit J